MKELKEWLKQGRNMEVTQELRLANKANSRPSTAERKIRKAQQKLVKKETITNAELQNVMQNAWVKVETEKQKQLNKINKLKNVGKQKRVQLRSQESINEEILVNQIVSKAFIEAGDIKKKKEKAKKKLTNSNSSYMKKKPLRSQESINEEKMFGKIMSEAWQEAEKLKKETIKMRKKSEMNRKKPKLHSQNSIMEEQTVKNIVNRAWKDTHPSENQK